MPLANGGKMKLHVGKRGVGNMQRRCSDLKIRMCKNDLFIVWILESKYVKIIKKKKV